MTRTVRNNLDFMAWRKLAMTISLLLMLASIVSLATLKLNVGIDFTGGSIIEVGYQQAVELEPIRDALETAGFADAIVQHFGSASEVLIRLVPDVNKDKAELSSEIIALLNDTSSTPIDVRRVDFVGPQVGEELTEDGGLAVLYALIAILIYVAFRFEYRFSLGSVAALVHDVVITLGVFSILQLNFDLTVLAAILAVIGYSLNDTIVVFDRIRENFRKMRKQTPVEVVNISINQTLSRPLRHDLSDPAHADDTEPLAGDLDADHEAGAPVLPGAGAHQHLALAGAPRRPDHQQHGGFCSGVAEHVGGVGDDQAAGLCSLRVLVVL